MKTVKTAKEMFLFAEDVMQITGLAKTKAYAIIRQLNAELEEKGVMTVQGRVNRKYFLKRFGLDETPETQRRKAAS